MRRWKVAGGLVVDDDGGLLLVANRRRSGSVDWSTPGGVIDEGETAIGALSREVEEETGLIVGEWVRRCWTVQVDFVDLEMHLAVEVHLAASFSGALRFDDPDGIVHEGAFLDHELARAKLVTGPRWVSEPLLTWLDGPWPDDRPFGYRARGDRLRDLVVERVDP